MAHEIETMMFVGETPWHRLGTKLDNPPTTAEAMRAAGLDWTVEVRPLLRADNGETVTHRATVRTSDDKTLGVVGPDYTPLQNRDAFAWFDPFVQANEATIETAGSLRGGSRIWVLAKLNRAPSTIVRGDDVVKYVLLANSHDGTLAGRVGFTPIRVVCQNTLSAAMGASASKLLRVKHTKGIKEALRAVRDVMNLADATFEATAEQYRTLAAHDVNPDDLIKYIRLVMKAPPAKPAADDLASLLDRPLVSRDDETSEKTRYEGKIVELFENGAGNTLPGVRGTYWAAYNAITEYTTHVRGRSDENRLAAMFADGAAINRRALDVGLTMARA